MKSLGTVSVVLLTLCYFYESANGCVGRGCFPPKSGKAVSLEIAPKSDNGVCLVTGSPCKGDGSWGPCCAGACFQKPEWSNGVCAPALLIQAHRQANACLGNGFACKADGSVGNCCSGFCYQQPQWPSGVCQNRS